MGVLPTSLHIESTDSMHFRVYKLYVYSFNTCTGANVPTTTPDASVSTTPHASVSTTPDATSDAGPTTPSANGDQGICVWYQIALKYL